jgi:endonuclease-3
MNDLHIDELIKILKKDTKKFVTPSVTFLKIHGADPYMILVSTIISLRTKDEVTLKSAQRLFSVAKKPTEMIKLDRNRIAELIYPAGFYNVKSQTILDVSKDIIDKYNGIVPSEVEELTQLKGVGRKTANLVVSLGYNKPAICVDTHVHRISNRLGYVNTKNPDSTEIELRKKLPQKYWIIYNDLLVTFGQNICKPIGPKCEICNLKKMCKFYQDN